MASLSPRRKESSASSLDGDLPPRIEGDVPPAYTAGPPPSAVEPSGEASPPDSELPKHAGFDLSAMKELIEDVEVNPADMQVQEAGQYPMPPVPPPTNRSESAPPPLHESPSTTPVVKSLELTPELESDRSADLSAVFQRSVSMSNLHEEPEAGIQSVYPQPSHAMPQDDFGVTSYYRPSVPSAPLSPDGFNSTWATNTTSKLDSQVFGNRSLGPSTDTLPFANHNRSTSSPHAFPHNPFSSSAVGLSFGGADGSITPVEAERDPWASSPIQTKVPGYSSNPWQS